VILLFGHRSHQIRYFVQDYPPAKIKNELMWVKARACKGDQALLCLVNPEQRMMLLHHSRQPATIGVRDLARPAADWGARQR
jgi:hypothetical protein